MGDNENTGTKFVRATAIPMMWDFAENNVFGEAAGGYMVSLRSIIKVIERFQTENEKSVAAQCDAQSDCGLENIMISTDPPYYDNIAYADLSDFLCMGAPESQRHLSRAVSDDARSEGGGTRCNAVPIRGEYREGENVFRGWHGERMQTDVCSCR